MLVAVLLALLGSGQPNDSSVVGEYYQGRSLSMKWDLRRATSADHDFLFELHRQALGPYAEQTWGWEETWQRQHFDSAFESANWQVIIVAGVAVGALRTSESESELNIDDIENPAGASAERSRYNNLRSTNQ